MSNWKKYKLGEIAEITSSKRIFLSDYVSEGIPFYRSKEIIEKFNKKKISTELFIEKSKYQKIKDEFGVPKENDLLLTSVGTIGIPYLVRRKDEFYFKDGNLTWFKNFNNNFLPKYLFYWTQSPIGKNAIEKTKIGSTQQALTIVSLKQIEIQAPDLPIQTQIAQILTSFDDKIELLGQMNQTLETMAQTIFKEWFVDFNFPGFDGEMVDGLPKGWRKGKLGEIFQPKKGRNITKAEAIEGEFPVVAGGLEPSCYHNKSNTNAPVVTVSSSGANAGFVRLYHAPVWSSDSCYIDNTIYPYVYFAYLFLKQNQSIIYNSQQGCAQPHIYPSHIMHLDVAIGNEKNVADFENLVTPLFEKILENQQQIRTLTQLRNTLLPKLMSGAVRVEGYSSVFSGDDLDTVAISDKLSNEPTQSTEK